MRKIVLLVAVLMLATPAMAAVTISCTSDANEVTVTFDNDEATGKVRAFALNITVDNDANIYDACSFHPEYYIYPGSIDVNENNGKVEGWGSPICDPCVYPGTGTLGGTGTGGMTVEMGSLYAGDDPCHPTAPSQTNQILVKFYVDKNCWVSIAENAARGGVVMEDPDADPNANLPCNNCCQATPVVCTVPYIVGDVNSAAQTEITTASLTVGTISEAYHNTTPVDEVIAQYPAGGTEVECSSDVNFTVSIGKPVVPDVTGMTEAAAEAAITAVDDLVKGSIDYAWHASVPAPNVCAQNPAGGTPVDIGSAVDLTLSRGPQPTNCMPAAGTGYDTQRAQFNTYVSNLWDPSGWCTAYQCFGDAAGDTTGFPANMRIYTTDLTLIINNWMKKAGTYPAGADPRADIDHKDTGFPANMRVYTADLSRVICYWMKKDVDLNANPRGTCPWTDAVNNAWTCP